MNQDFKSRSFKSLMHDLQETFDSIVWKPELNMQTYFWSLVQLDFGWNETTKILDMCIDN